MLKEVNVAAYDHNKTKFHQIVHSHTWDWVRHQRAAITKCQNGQYR